MSRMERRVHEQYPEARDRYPIKKYHVRRTRILINHKKLKKKRRIKKSRRK